MLLQEPPSRRPTADTEDTLKPATVADPPLQAPLPPTALRPQSPSAPSLSRGVLLRTVFHLCDVDGDGFLNSDEMQRFARQKGFDGTQAEWLDEYNILCREVNVDPAKGIDVLVLERLANDASSCGCYCDDGELQAMRARLEQADKTKLEVPFLPHGLIKDEAGLVKTVSLKDMPAPEEGTSAALRSRTDLVHEVFTTCDADGDGRLTCWEMRRFADWTGFQGDAQAWNNEYRLLCLDHKADPSAGVDLTLFTEMVSDDSDSGCYCTNSELQSMLAQWRREELGPRNMTSAGLSTTR